MQDYKIEGSIVFFGVEDLEQTDKFYRQHLGLILDRDQGLCRIYAVPGGGKLGFCSHIPVFDEKKGAIITLLTDNVDALYQDLKGKGVALAGEPEKNDKFNIYHFFLTDPDGYLVEIQSFLD